MNAGMETVAARIMTEAFGVSTLADLEAAIHELPAEPLQARLSPVLAKHQDAWKSAFGWTAENNANPGNAIGVFRFMLKRFGLRLSYRRVRVGGELTYLYTLLVPSVYLIDESEGTAHDH